MDDVTLALRQLREAQQNYKVYRDYYNGRQRMAFASDSFRQAFAGQVREVVYNRCAAVVDSMVDRLRITGWQDASGAEDATSPLEQAALDIWIASRLDLRHLDAHNEAMTCGDAYLIVWPNMETGEPQIAVQQAHQIAVVRDDEAPDRIVLAVKAWRITRGPLAGRWRITTYAPDVIRRWITTGSVDDLPSNSGTLVPYEDEAAAETPNPWGVTPVFGLHNASGMDLRGVSELRDLIPLQDGVNKSIADMLVAMEYVAYPQRWVTGVEVPIDPETGRPMKPFKPGVDRVWIVGDEGAQMGEFAQGDMTQFIGVQQEWDAKISRVSRVPVHWLGMTGSIPSGEALKVSEAPFVSKMQDRQADFGSVWSDAMALALQMGGYGVADASTIAPVWANAETRSESDFWRTAELKARAGVPQQQIWREAGYTPGQIDEFEQQAADAQLAQAQAFGAAFDRGVVV
jgi:hypothetical protein